jgi:hypothetical protein
MALQSCFQVTARFHSDSLMLVEIVQVGHSDFATKVETNEGSIDLLE